MCRAMLLLCLLGACGAVPMGGAQENLAKLMRLGYGLAEQAKKGVDHQAFVTGEKVGLRLRQDQKNTGHSVETKLSAAREGLKDSLQDYESGFKAGMAEARAVVETPDVREAVQSVRAAVAGNPELTYFADQSGQMLQQASDSAKAGIEKTVQSLPDENAQKVGSSFLQAFATGEDEERARLAAAQDGEEKYGDAAAQEEKFDAILKGHLDKLQSKAGRLVESARKAAAVGLDRAPQVLLKASEAADGATMV